MQIKLGTFLVVSLLFSGCASKTPKSEELTGTKGTLLPIQLLFSNHRNLELEPCGCSMSPSGGLHREFNYVSNLREKSPDLLYFVSGTSFVPDLDLRKNANRGVHELKAKALMKAYKQLGVSVLAPSANDLYWGKKLKSWSDAEQIPVVSTNLVDKSAKPLFKTYIIYQRAGVSIAILSVTRKPRETVPVSKEYALLEPELSLSRVFEEEAVKKADLVVLLSTLNEKDNENLKARFPRVNLFLGGESSIIDAKLSQNVAEQFAIRIENRGRAIARIGLGNKLPVIGLENSKKVKDHLYTQEVYADTLKELELDMKRETDATKISQMKVQKERMENFIVNSKKMLGVFKQGSTAYDYDLDSLTFEYDKASKNPMDEILADLKTQVRDLATKH